MSGSIPTVAGFQTFITNVMQIPVLALPLNSPIITYAFNTALMVVNQSLQAAGCPSGSQWSIYTLAVYNLSGSNLVNWAPDQPGYTYFADLRKSYGITNSAGISNFAPGVVASTSDNGTSTSLLNPEFLKGLTLANLQQIKDPWGRQYLMFAQDYGPGPWGIS